MLNWTVFFTFRGFGLFRDALFPGKERSNVNFKPSPVKATWAEQRLIKAEFTYSVQYIQILKGEG